MKATKTPLLKSIMQAFKEAGIKFRPRTVKQDTSRRKFITKSMLVAAGLAAPSILKGKSAAGLFDDMGMNKRVGIVGGGVAGLYAAYLLQQSHIDTVLFESSKRTGGRMHSSTDLMGKGLTTELGGEFIDSTYEDILNLAKTFDLRLLDMDTDQELHKYAFHADGRLYTINDMAEALKPFADVLQQDIDSLPEEISYRDPGNAEELDKMSISAYLESRGINDWVRTILEVAFTTEYGLEASEQSAINFLYLFKPGLTDKNLFGDSDERYKIVGGNQRIVDELAKRVKGIELEHELQKIEQMEDKVNLHFHNGKVQSFDYVICAIPFTRLRQVEMEMPDIPEVKSRCIEQLGYGVNAKLFAGFKSRYWRLQGYAGEVFTEQSFQLGWDHTQLQPGTAGGFTFYTGGNYSDRMLNKNLTSKTKQYVAELERVFPGAKQAHNGVSAMFHWPTHAHTLGSYACYRTGQWTTIAGAEIEPIRNLYFAGEHCSADFQGFMNGGAETGRKAAAMILERIESGNR